MKSNRMFSSCFQPRIGLTAIAVIASAALPSEAVIGVKNSASFAFKYEMTNVTEGVDPAGNTASWNRVAGGSPPTPTLASGLLSVDTSAAVGQYVWWETSTTVGNDALGATIETRVRINSIAGSNDRVFLLYLGDNADSGIVMVGATKTYWLGGPSATESVIDSQLNNDGFHVFRIFEDSSTTDYSVERDGIVIASGLAGYPGPTGVFAARPMIFGDASSSNGGNFDVDYVRFDITGGFLSVPEPATMALIGLGGLAFVLRRRTR